MFAIIGYWQDGGIELTKCPKHGCLFGPQASILTLHSMLFSKLLAQPPFHYFFGLLWLQNFKQTIVSRSFLHRFLIFFK
jgi:hypothetical protein